MNSDQDQSHQVNNVMRKHQISTLQNFKNNLSYSLF